MTSTYTGHVDPDGPWADRVDGVLRLRKLSVEEMDNNVYVLACARTGAALLVDLAARPERLRAATAEVELVAAVQTHGHWDHVRAWEALADEGLPIWGHRDEAPLYPRPCDRWLEDGDVLVVGDLRVEVLHVPGHTPGSLLLLVEEGVSHPHLITGDSLFPGGFGATFGDADAFAQLSSGIVARVFDRLQDSTWVYPGHGDDTTLGAERPHLAEYVARGW